MSTFAQSFLAARRVATPLIAIRTPDPALTQRTILEITKDTPLKEGSPEPVLAWDCINGILGINDAGKEAAKKIVRQGNTMIAADSDNSVNATEALVHALNLPKYGMLLMSNAHRGTMPDQNPNWIQACWNLRESLKNRAATVVLLGPDFDFPAELAQDILTLDEPLPNEDELRRIVLRVFSSVDVAKPDAAIVEKAVDATCGLASFPAEQVSAMSLKRDKETKQVSMDIDALWERKRQMIEQTPGLSVWRGREKFSDIGGLANAKEFFSRMLAGNETPRAIVFVDEIEKAFSGATSGSADSSGVSQGFLGTILTEMQDQDYTGIICVGPPGAGKSAMAKAVGSEGAIPTISLDLGAMKGSLVGSSLHGSEEIYFCDKSGQNTHRMTIEEAYAAYQPTDEIYTWSHSDYCGSHVARVLDVIRHDRIEKFLKFRTSSGREVIVTEGHSLFKRKIERYPFGQGKYQQSPILQVAEANTLKIGDAIAIVRNLPWTDHPTTRIQRDFYTIPLTEDLMTLIGLWLGDGSVNNNMVRISSSIEEPEIGEFLSRFGQVTAYRKAPGKGVDFTINNVELTHTMRSLGLCTHSQFSHTKRLPDWVFGCSEKMVCALLRGYFSADGCFSGHNLEASTVSERLASDVALLLSKVNIFARIRKKAAGKGSDKLYAGHVIRGKMMVYNISMAKSKEVNIFKRKIGFMQAKKNAKLDASKPSQKYKKGRAYRSVFFDPIVSIEEVSSTDPYCYDLSVEEHEKFVAGGIVVHNSERSLRSALKVIRAVSQGRAYWIATSNKVSVLPPELRRRFADSCMFVDLPSEEERAVIWPIYLNRFGIPQDMPRPDDNEWTGAEIRTCCRNSYRLKIDLIEASKYIVPVARSGEEQIRDLRNQANGKFISASYPGYYRHQSAEIANNAMRAITQVPEE